MLDDGREPTKPFRQLAPDSAATSRLSVTFVECRSCSDIGMPARMPNLKSPPRLPSSESAGLSKFPDPVRLETAGQMIMLGIGSLTEPEFPEAGVDQEATSFHRLSVNLVGDNAVDHVEVLLGEDDVCFPSWKQLRLGRCSRKARENRKQHSDRYRHGRPPFNHLTGWKGSAQLYVPAGNKNADFFSRP